MPDTQQDKQVTTSPKEVSPGALASGRKRVSRVLPPGYSWLSVPLPTQTLNNLNIMARMSNLSLRSYMERFCAEAVDYPPTMSSPGGTPEHAPAATGK